MPMAEMLDIEIADYVLTGWTLIAPMEQLLSKTPMAEMLGVKIADHVLTRP
jgi:hypothetical protein